MPKTIVTPGGNRIVSQDHVTTTRATNDDQLIALFLSSLRSAHTRTAYQRSINIFRQFAPAAFDQLNLEDALGFRFHLTELYPNSSTQKLKLNTIKSLFSFAVACGYLGKNIFAAVKSPRIKDDLAARILTEEEVLSMIALTTKPRDKMILRLLYVSAARVSELTALTWRDCQASGDGGQVTLYGKGGKTRAVKLSRDTWAALQAHRANTGINDPLFTSQKGGRLQQCQVHRIVKAAAVRAGIKGNVSPHWLRHSHASHAIDRGASIAVVRDTLGHSSLAITSRYTHARPNDSSALHLAL
jgi:integrase/recombinase XerD